MLRFCLFVLAVLLLSVSARHIHIHADPEQNKLIDEIFNTKPSRFVPLNNELFFKSIEPCEDGFKRDLLGICREVWD